MSQLIFAIISATVTLSIALVIVGCKVSDSLDKIDDTLTKIKNNLKQ